MLIIYKQLGCYLTSYYFYFSEKGLAIADIIERENNRLLGANGDRGGVGLLSRKKKKIEKQGGFFTLNPSALSQVIFGTWETMVVKMTDAIFFFVFFHNTIIVNHDE